MKRTWGPRESKIVAARQKWCCAMCKELLSSTFELDHVVPLHLGGADDYESNAAALCVSCHAAKTQKEMIELDRVRREAKRIAMDERMAAIKKAREDHPPPPELTLSPMRTKKKPRPPPPLMPGHPDFIDDLTVENPFLRFAYDGPLNRRYR